MNVEIETEAAAVPFLGIHKSKFLCSLEYAVKMCYSVSKTGTMRGATFPSYEHFMPAPPCFFIV